MKFNNFILDCYVEMFLLILEAQQTAGICTAALNSFKDCIFSD